MLEATLKVKPLSANSMYYNVGRHKKKTKEYEQYQLALLDELMGTSWPFDNRQVAITVWAGLSARQADLDNVLKPLLDSLQGIYPDFNDNKVYEIFALKEIVPKGEEYMKIRIEEHEERTTKEVSE